MPYRNLDRSKIIQTAQRLVQRIGERFPNSSLRNVAVKTVNDIENLGTNLSRNIWQKIMLVVDAPKPRRQAAQSRKKA